MQRTTKRIDSLIVASVLLVLAAGAGAQPRESDESEIGTRIDFESSGAPSLDSDSDVIKWVNESLHSQLGLAGTDHLEIDGEPSRLGDYFVYKVEQTVRDLPVVYHESRLSLDAHRRPTALLGLHSAFQNVPSSNPAVALEQARSSLHPIGEPEPSGRLGVLAGGFRTAPGS